MIALDHCILPSLQICCGNLRANLNVLIDKRGLETMDGYARLCECILRLRLAEPSLADFHAGGFGEAQSPISILDREVELREISLDRCACAVAMVIRLVAAHAHTRGSCAKHCIRRMLDAVVGVADDASGKGALLKRLAVRALRIHLGLEDVAVRAYVLHLVDTRRHRTMVSVAGGAGGRTEVPADHHRIVVDAGVVLRKLIGGYPVLLHVGCIGVAARAGLGDVHGVETVERGSLGGLRSWTLWQSVQTATLVSPAARRLPCMLVWY